MNDEVVLGIMGMMIPIVLVPVVMGFRHARQQREMEHKERMRALELGSRLPGDEPWANPARISVAIGAGVPVGVFFWAWLASVTVRTGEEVWVMAGLVGVAAVISGSILAAKHLNHQAAAEAAALAYHDRAIHEKPVVDADAFDVVSARG